jgi:hypothetical protein
MDDANLVDEQQVMGSNDNSSNNHSLCTVTTDASVIDTDNSNENLSTTTWYSQEFK